MSNAAWLIVWPRGPRRNLPLPHQEGRSALAWQLTDGWLALPRSERSGNARSRSSRPGTGRSPFRLPLWFGFVAFLAIAPFFPWSEHRAHILGALPFAAIVRGAEERGIKLGRTSGFESLTGKGVRGGVDGRAVALGNLSLPAPVAPRLAGEALLLVGLALAGASSKARLLAGRGRLANGGPYARLRHPLYVGLSLVLAGGLLRAPSTVGAFTAAIAIAQYAWLGALEERDSLRAFGADWTHYASRTRALLPLRRSHAAPNDGRE